MTQLAVTPRTQRLADFTVRLATQATHALMASGLHPTDLSTLIHPLVTHADNTELCLRGEQSAVNELAAHECARHTVREIRNLRLFLRPPAAPALPLRTLPADVTLGGLLRTLVKQLSSLATHHLNSTDAGSDVFMVGHIQQQVTQATARAQSTDQPMGVFFAVSQAVTAYRRALGFRATQELMFLERGQTICHGEFVYFRRNRAALVGTEFVITGGGRVQHVTRQEAVTHLSETIERVTPVSVQDAH